MPRLSVFLLGRNTAMRNTPQLILGTGNRYGGSSERELLTIPARSLPHMLVSGVTGSGKSYFAAALAASAMAAGIQVIIPDITGSTWRILLKILLTTGYFQSPSAFQRLICLDLANASARGIYPPCNVLQTGFDPHATSEMVVESIRRVSSLHDSYINVALLFKIGAYVLAHNNLPLFPFLYYLFTEPDLRARLLATIDDEIIKSAFAQFGFTRDGTVPASMQPTIKRLQLLVMNPILRYSLGQQENILDIAALLRSGSSAIINLNLPSPDAARIWAALLMANIEMVTPSRGEVSDARPPRMCLLLLDEFQTFISHSETALSAALERFRKHNIRVCLLHQHFGQVPEHLLGALSQCGIVVAFHLDRRSDAKISAELLKLPYDEFLPKPVFVNRRRPYAVTPQFYSRSEQQEMHIDAITSLRPREAFIQLPDQRQGSVVYTMQTLTVDDSKVNPQKLSEIEETYFQLYFRPQAEIDTAITARLQSLLNRSVDISRDDTINLPSSSYGKHDIHQEREIDDDEWQYLREERR
jgi:hypothetical protein